MKTPISILSHPDTVDFITIYKNGSYYEYTYHSKSGFYVTMQHKDLERINNSAQGALLSYLR